MGVSCKTPGVHSLTLAATPTSGEFVSASVSEWHFCKGLVCRGLVAAIPAAMKSVFLKLTDIALFVIVGEESNTEG